MWSRLVLNVEFHCGAAFRGRCVSFLVAGSCGISRQTGIPLESTPPFHSTSFERFPSLFIQRLPTVREDLNFPEQAEEMKLLSEIIRSVRTIRAEVQTPMSKKVPLILSAKDEKALATLENNAAYIEKFCNDGLAFVRQVLPDFFRDERHEWMQQAHCLVKYVRKN